MFFVNDPTLEPSRDDFSYLGGSTASQAAFSGLAEKVPTGHPEPVRIHDRRVVSELHLR